MDGGPAIDDAAGHVAGRDARQPSALRRDARDADVVRAEPRRVAHEVAGHPAMTAILTTCHRLFDALTPQPTRPLVWHVEVHQFRIEAKSEQQGLPTPEGMHRDGVDWVLVLLVKRENIASGETRMEDVAHRPLGSFTLTEPLDAALVDDERVFHGVTPVRRLDEERAAHRDVLVVTFRERQFGGHTMTSN
jgi:hypothetical protein